MAITAQATTAATATTMTDITTMAWQRPRPQPAIQSLTACSSTSRMIRPREPISAMTASDTPARNRDHHILNLRAADAPPFVYERQRHREAAEHKAPVRRVRANPAAPAASHPPRARRAPAPARRANKFERMGWSSTKRELAPK